MGGTKRTEVSNHFDEDGKILSIYGLNEKEIISTTPSDEKNIIEIQNEETLESKYNGDYLYTASLVETPGIKIKLRDDKSLNAGVIRICKPGSKIWVLNTEDKIFFKVYAEGHIGFLAKGFIE